MEAGAPRAAAQRQRGARRRADTGDAALRRRTGGLEPRGEPKESAGDPCAPVCARSAVESARRFLRPQPKGAGALCRSRAFTVTEARGHGQAGPARVRGQVTGQDLRTCSRPRRERESHEFTANARAASFLL